MPEKIWIPNVEEVLPENDVHYEKVFIPKTLEIFPRFLFCLRPGDRIISPMEINGDFCSYVSGLSGLGPPEKWLMKLSNFSKPYSLAESAAADAQLLRELRAFSSLGNCIIEPFIESPRVIRLSAATGIPTDKTNPQLVLNGIISKLNDKGVFKRLASELGIKAISGYLAESMAAAEKAVKLVASENGDRVMLKKTLYGGGLGNMSGGKDLLIKKLPEWYSGGRLLVEPLLNIKKVYGSLSVIDSGKTVFLGVDEQYFCDGKWTGFDFPSEDGAVCERIKRAAEKIALEFYRQGARGFVNIDWAATMEEPEDPLAMECNLRNNGFNYVLDFASRYFGVSQDKIRIRYREGVSCGDLDAGGLLKKLEKIKAAGEPLLVKGPGRKRGAVLMTPPSGGKCSIGLFSGDPGFIKEATLAMLEAGL